MSIHTLNNIIISLLLYSHDFVICIIWLFSYFVYTWMIPRPTYTKVRCAKLRALKFTSIAFNNGPTRYMTFHYDSNNNPKQNNSYDYSTNMAWDKYCNVASWFAVSPSVHPNTSWNIGIHLWKNTSTDQCGTTITRKPWTASNGKLWMMFSFSRNARRNRMWRYNQWKMT